MSRIAANRISPPYWMTVSSRVVREDSSAPRATSQVVITMKTAAMRSFSQSGGSGMPSPTLTALTMMPEAPTPARMLDSISA